MSKVQLHKARKIQAKDEGRAGTWKPVAPQPKASGMVDELTAQIYLLMGVVGLMWVLEIFDQTLGLGLDSLGIFPRHWTGLRGLVFAPFLHGNFPHLLANTVPFFSLGWLVMLRRTQDFFWVTLTVMLLGGFGTWLIGDLFRDGPPSIHVGASILIFGYLGFLMLRGYFERRPGSILLSVMVVVVYGGLLWGVLPGQPGISWEGHFSGFLAGIFAARLLADRPRNVRSYR